MAEKKVRPKAILRVETDASPGPPGEPPRVGPQDAAPPPEQDAALRAETAETARFGRPRMGFWVRLLLWAVGLLATLQIALAAERLVLELMARAPWAAWGAAALVAAAALALVALTARELAAIGRLRRVEALREDILAAAASGDARRARVAMGDLERLYRGRKDVVDVGAWRRLRDLCDDAVDADARLALYEREVMAPLDAQARAAARHGARRVAAFTAIAPSVVLDALGAMYFNLAMIRRIGQIYGGRAGVAGTWRLARRVVAHAMAAGLIAIGEDLLEPLLGGGVAAKASRRIGEGVVNGALTARLGLAAIDVCRPMPFSAVKRPTLRHIFWEALTG